MCFTIDHDFDFSVVREFNSIAVIVFISLFIDFSVLVSILFRVAFIIVSIFIGGFFLIILQIIVCRLF
jgi:hypothetical protein